MCSVFPARQVGASGAGDVTHRTARDTRCVVICDDMLCFVFGCCVFCKLFAVDGVIICGCLDSVVYSVPLQRNVWCMVYVRLNCFV